MKEYQNVRWKGYLRQGGRKGVRNKLPVAYTVERFLHVAKEIARCIDSSDVDAVGFDGCYDNEYTVRFLLVLIRHPNVGGVLAAGPGCEYVQPKYLAEKALGAEKPAQWLSVQEYGGTRPSIEYGLQQAHLLPEEFRQTPVVPMGLSDLIVGAEYGGSDYTSGLAGNVVVGRSYDKPVDLSGTVIFEEIVEMVGLKDLPMQWAAGDCVREQLAYTYNKALEYCKSVRQYSISPGNFAGGLSSIEEKSMGATIKSGSRPISGVIKVS